MRELQDETGTADLLITHDLGVVAETCDEVIVMYAGQVVEQAPVEDLSPSRSTPTRWGCSARCRARREARAAGRHHRDGAGHGRSPRGLPLPAALPLPHRARARKTPELMEVAPGHFSRCWRAPLETLVP